LPKAPSSYSLSPQRRKRVRVRRDKKELLAMGITDALSTEIFFVANN
jgi:hypothetical protein